MQLSLVFSLSARRLGGRNVGASSSFGGGLYLMSLEGILA
jgi:hypothetical protein